MTSVIGCKWMNAHSFLLDEDTDKLPGQTLLDLPCWFEGLTNQSRTHCMILVSMLIATFSFLMPIIFSWNPFKVMAHRNFERAVQVLSIFPRDLIWSVPINSKLINLNYLLNWHRYVLKKDEKREFRLILKTMENIGNFHRAFSSCYVITWYFSVFVG